MPTDGGTRAAKVLSRFANFASSAQPQLVHVLSHKPQRVGARRVYGQQIPHAVGAAPHR